MFINVYGLKFMKLPYIYIYIYIYIYRYISIYGNHIDFRPIQFSSYGNLKEIFETTSRYLPF